jgi:hypothetical protein
MGRPFVMLTVTSAANHARLDSLLAIQRRLADPRTITMTRSCGAAGRGADGGADHARDPLD